VGLGGSGLAAVLELVRLGKRVVALDAGAVAGGAAGRNGGFLLAGLADFHHDAVARHGRERARRLYRLTLAELDRIAMETPEAVRRVGSIRLAASPEEVDDCRAQLAAMQADGLSAEWYEGALGVGLRIPTDAGFQPVARAHALARQALAGGARLFARSPAVAIAGDAVATPEGRVRCGATVVAVDGGLDAVLPELAGRVRSARLQMLATAPTDEVRLPCPVYARWGYDYWQQDAMGRVALGGCRDLAMDDEWTHDATPSAVMQARLDAVLRERVGVRAAPVTHRWAASVGYTDDGLPVLAEVRSGVWAAGGYGGTGNVVGALCGRAAARRALGLPDAMAALLGRGAA
jgi:glycine/D-amino acid oxidase-like deaminating enzyme